jgi:hypothetical protein
MPVTRSRARITGAVSQNGSQLVDPVQSREESAGACRSRTRSYAGDRWGSRWDGEDHLFVTNSRAGHNQGDVDPEGLEAMRQDIRDQNQRSAQIG